MGKRSTKTDKNIYFKIRDDELNLTRAEAADIMDTVSESRLENIEYGTTAAQPEDVVEMAAAYKRPDLCRYYCANECAIGKKYEPGVVSTGVLSDIVLKLLSSMNSLEKEKDKLIDITADGQIGDDELEDFARIENELDKAELTIQAMKLWVEKTVADGKIDKDKLEEVRRRIKD